MGNRKRNMISIELLTDIVMLVLLAAAIHSVGVGTMNLGPVFAIVF